MSISFHLVSSDLFLYAMNIENNEQHYRKCFIEEKKAKAQLLLKLQNLQNCLTQTQSTNIHLNDILDSQQQQNENIKVKLNQQNQILKQQMEQLQTSNRHLNNQNIKLKRENNKLKHNLFNFNQIQNDLQNIYIEIACLKESINSL